MKTAVFYENLWEGAQAAGRTVEDVLTQMHAEGMDKLYLSVDSWKRDRETLAPMLRKLDIGIEGMHGWCDFSTDPDRNVTVLIGKNTAGKTTFVRAFEWILYNDKEEFEDKVLLNSEIAKRLKVGFSSTVEGTLIIEHNNVEYNKKN